MNESSTRKILVTAALPYANGHIHIGHLVEYLQTDIWARFQRAAGHRVAYICADDTHGTAIMMRARQEGRSEDALIAEMSEAHQHDFSRFQIAFDHYGSTNSAANRELCEGVWKALREQGLVEQRTITQLFDPKEGVFLADRFVKGTCPKCSSPDQYGDSCDKCGSTYSPTDLVDPVSVLSGATPVIKQAEHLFVRIESFHEFLDGWTQAPGNLQPSVANYLKGHFLSEPLRDWDVSRPSPYFGFEIPDAPGNYWYVWFDAPIGYIASTKEWCDKNGDQLDAWWRSDDTEIHHFIGKDITYFHTLFWPAMLKAGGFSLPKRVQIHGFLTVNGEKMSKSKGTMIRASSYLEHLDPAYLRYYYASKLTAKVDDLDLGLDEFVNKVNSDLVGKVVNLASRSARFLKDSGFCDPYPDDEGLFAKAAADGVEIAAAYDQCDFAKATRMIMQLADRANEYFDRKQPWALVKQDKADEAVRVCSVALNLYRQIAIFLGPVLPKLAAESGELLGESLSAWSAADAPRVGSAVGEFKHLMQRVDPKAVAAMVETSVVGGEPEAAAASSGTASDDSDREPIAETCTIDDFSKIDLRVAKVVSAEAVPKADKLLKLVVDIGAGETRTIFAGIKAYYEPSALVGRNVIVVANLKPRKMKFGLSEGMVIAASSKDGPAFVLGVDDGAQPGDRAR